MKIVLMLILGTNFLSADWVTIHGEVTEFRVLSDEAMVVNAPEGTSSVTVCWGRKCVVYFTISTLD